MTSSTSSTLNIDLDDLVALADLVKIDNPICLVDFDDLVDIVDFAVIDDLANLDDLVDLVEFADIGDIVEARSRSLP